MANYTTIDVPVSHVHIGPLVAVMIFVPKRQRQLLLVPRPRGLCPLCSLFAAGPVVVDGTGVDQ